MIKKNKALRFFLFFCLLFTGFSVPALAIEKSDDWDDEDKDGRNESHFFYEDEKVVRVEIDKNADGKADAFFHFKDEKRTIGDIDTDFDGAIDQWIYYDERGNTKRIGKDTNQDGKIDEFMEYVQGRQVILKEADKNFDGRIDSRRLSVWGEKKLIPGQPPVPGYKTFWLEEDTDFDGKIDVYREKGKEDPKSKRIGQPIAASAPPATEQDKPKNDRIKSLNDQHSLS